jgi:hypothetical protein
MAKCRVCRGTGQQRLPVEDDWGGVEYWIEVPCDVCYNGEVDPEELAEMRACYGPEYMW